MSIQQDRLTFFGVLIAVVVVVIGYLQLGQLYPTTGRANMPAYNGGAAEQNTTEEFGPEADAPSPKEEDAAANDPSGGP